MIKITLIHTVKSVLDSFEGMLREACSEELAVSNIYDSFLADDPDELGYVSEACKRKLFMDVLSAMENKPDIIAVTCSAMSETVKQLRPFVDRPLIAIDERMIAEAVRSAGRIRVLATAVSSAVTTKDTLMREAEKTGRTIEIEATDNVDAFGALQAGDQALHDRLVLDQAKGVQDADIIVLAQASMAHLADDIQKITGIRTLSSPGLCIQEICDAAAKIGTTKMIPNPIDHVALYTEDIDWFVNFFEAVFGMTVRESEEETDDSPRQVWMDQGIQLTACRRENRDDRGALYHFGVSVYDLETTLKKAYSFPEVFEMEQGRNWLQLPDGISIEVLDE